jgi:hypothetical protein
MQATSPSAQPGIDQSLEVQNRPVHVERIDPAVLQFICFLFPCQFEGMKFLALLCRRAAEKQLAFYKEPVAVLTFVPPPIGPGDTMLRRDTSSSFRPSASLFV